MFELEPRGAGYLRLSVYPEESEVTLDGASVGLAPDLKLPDKLTRLHAHSRRHATPTGQHTRVANPDAGSTPIRGPWRAPPA